MMGSGGRGWARVAALAMGTVALLALLGAVCGTLVGLPSGGAHAARAVGARPSGAVLPHARAVSAERGAVTHVQAMEGSPPGNFPFQTARSSDGKIVVHFYGQPASYGAAMLGEVRQALSRQVEPSLGLRLTAPVTLYFYNSLGDFDAGAVPTQPETTGAYTDFSISTIYLPDYGAPFTYDVISHELTHVVLYQHADTGHLANDFYLYPRWLDEGLAESDVPIDQGYAAQDDAALAQGLANHTFVNIFTRFLWSYPDDVTTDNLCYAEARNFIQFLKNAYGMTKFHTFVGQLADGNVDLAAETAFGVDLQTLRARWDTSLGQPAPKHAAGVLPTPETAVPFKLGVVTSIADRTASYAPRGGDDWLAPLGTLDGIGLALVLLSLAATGLLALRRRKRARTGSKPTYGQTPSAMVGAPSSAPLAGGMARGDAPFASRPTAAAATTTLERPTPARSRLLRAAPFIVLALLVPLAGGLSVLYARLDGTYSWQREYVVAAAITAGALVVAIALLVVALRAKRRTPAHIVTPLVLAALAALMLVNAGPAGQAEGKIYEQDGAYALAYTTLANAGAATSDLARVQLEWAQTADSFGAYAEAAEHYRDALALGPASDSAQSAARELTSITTRWGTLLRQAHQYARAVQVYADQLATPSCEQNCQQTMRDALGTTYLAWARDQITSGHISDGLATLRTLSQRLPQSSAGTTAGHVLANPRADIGEALKVGLAGDSSGMDLLLAMIAIQQRGSLAAEEASAAVQPVTGQLASVEMYKHPIHLYFLAFHGTASASTFFDTYRDGDTSLFKVAAHTDASGRFTAWLPAGYTYVMIWEARAKDSYDDWFNWSRNLITVQPFTPVALSNSIVG